MPTGYTAGVQSGEVTTLEQFALQCARAFGATILMRDEPLDAEIPEGFQVGDYYIRSLKSATQERDLFSSLSEQERREQFEMTRRDRIEEAQRRIAEMNNERERYQSMIDKVREWVPPTSEHEEMKRFMLQQLRESMDFDCGTTFYDDEIRRWNDMTFGEWQDNKIVSLDNSIRRATERLRDEEKRTQGRNEWLKSLRESVKGK